jgi:hypothetical protein
MITSVAILGLIVMFLALALSAYGFYLIENKGRSELRPR